jgi:membrane protein DedA with SNARE-associated domain
MSYCQLHTTYPILFLAVLGRQLCLPIRALLFLLSAGALAGSGRLSLAWILAVAVLGCLIADLAWFEARRFDGRRVLLTATQDRGNGGRVFCTNFAL